jgi:hypothetical protein
VYRNALDVNQTLHAVVDSLQDPYYFTPEEEQRRLTRLKNAKMNDAQRQKYRWARELVRVYNLFKNWWVKETRTTQNLDGKYSVIRERFTDLTTKTNAENKKHLLLEHLLYAKKEHFGRFPDSTIFFDVNPNLEIVRAALQNVAELTNDYWTTRCTPQA